MSTFDAKVAKIAAMLDASSIQDERRPGYAAVASMNVDVKVNGIEYAGRAYVDRHPHNTTVDLRVYRDGNILAGGPTDAAAEVIRAAVLSVVDADRNFPPLTKDQAHAMLVDQMVEAGKSAILEVAYKVRQQATGGAPGAEAEAEAMAILLDYVRGATLETLGSK